MKPWRGIYGEVGHLLSQRRITGSAFDSAVREFACGIAALDRSNFALIEDKFKDYVGELSRAKF